MFLLLQTCNEVNDFAILLYAMCERHTETMYLNPKHLSFHKITQLNVMQLPNVVS